MILVTGANGTTGSEVVRQLVAQRRAVRAMLRKPEKAAQLPKQGVEFVVGSFSDKQSLGKAMEGVDAVFMISFDDPDQLALQGNVIDAAKRAGVRMVARLSAATADPDSDDPLIGNHGKGDRQLARSGLGHVLLRPQWFDQNFLTYCPGGVIRLPAGEGRLAFVDVRDIGAVAVKTLTEPGHDGQAYVLTGPEALNHAEVAAVLSQATGKKFEYRDITPEVYRRELIEAGTSEYFAGLVTDLFARVRSRRVGEIHDDIRRVLGRSAIAFRQFAMDYADEIAKQVN